jgi:hypothetical protein
MKLIAKWLNGLEPACDDPHSVNWEDGSAATMQEFYAHFSDTSIGVQTDAGLEWHMFPEIVAEIYWCPWGRAWGVRGDGVAPASLYVTDPDASDGELLSAVSAMPIWYRANIVR